MLLKPKEKLFFYLNYFYSKFFGIWSDVKTPRINLFACEALYSLSKFYKPLERFAFAISIDFIDTKFGKFHLRPHTMDVICASPAFERPDLDFLIKLIIDNLKGGKRTLFLDIGANVGTYSVTIGNLFKKTKNLKILCFEPDLENFEMLKRNIKINKLFNLVEIYNFALSNKDSWAYILHDDFNPGGSKISSKKSSKIKTRKLDSLSLDFNNYEIVIKIDVEGHEQQVLEGSRNSLLSAKKVTIAVEDFIKPSIINYMLKNNFKFLQKITPYNSWWSRNEKI